MSQGLLRMWQGSVIKSFSDGVMWVYSIVGRVVLLVWKVKSLGAYEEIGEERARRVMWEGIGVGACLVGVLLVCVRKELCCPFRAGDLFVWLSRGGGEGLRC